MAQRPPVRLTEAQIRRMAAARGIDPDAAIRVASAEGLSGAIGDGGHAFGPFQLNNAGGVLTGRFAGQSAEQINRWAWSPQGVAYALAGIGKVAKGLKGADAVRAIVTKFERPANPEGEIARALAYSGAGSSSGRMPGSEPGGGGSTPSPAAFQPPPQDSRRSLLLALANVAPGPQGNFTPFLNQLRQSRTSPSPETTPGPAPAPPPMAPAPATSRGGSLAELLHEGVGGPTHSTGEHVHVASTDPQVMLALIREAQRRHLATLENPYVDPVAAGVHAPRSYHKRTFPGRYNGRQLGEALDVSGRGMNDYEAWVRARYGRR